MYSSHRINPRLFFIRQSLHSKYLHMYNYLAAVYKVRHDQRHRHLKSSLQLSASCLLCLSEGISTRGFNTFNGFTYSTFDGREMKCDKLHIVHQNQIGGDRSPKKKKKKAHHIM